MPLYLAADASLLAVPNLASCVEEAELILRRIIYWSKYVSANTPRIAIMSNTVETLVLGGYFPSPPNVVALLQMFHLEGVYSSRDIQASINTILDRSIHLLDALDVEVVDHTHDITNPDLGAFRHERVLYTAAISCFCSSICGVVNSTFDIAFAVSGMPIPPGPLQIKCQVDEIIGNGTFFAPFSVFGTTQLIETLTDAAVLIGSTALWRNAREASELHLAIATRAVELLRASGREATLGDVAPFGIGTEFFNSLATCDARGDGGHAKVVLEACARIVLGDPKYQVEPLRQNRRGRSEILRRTDSASARRTHVTKRHEAIRLMFWSRPGMQIEFANIGAKGELKIYEGDIRNAFHMRW